MRHARKMELYLGMFALLMSTTISFAASNVQTDREAGALSTPSAHYRYTGSRKSLSTRKAGKAPISEKQKMPTTTTAPSIKKPTAAAPAAEDAATYSKAANNPVDTRFMQIPLQPNINFGQGPRNYRNVGLVTKLQPLIPINFTDDWTLLFRPIIPFANSNPRSSKTVGDEFGFGDVMPNFYFLPKKSMNLGGNWVFLWSLGPNFQAPTASAQTLGSTRWAVGPSGAFVFNNDPFTAAFVWSQDWSVGDRRSNSLRHSVNSATLQPIISYTFPNSVYLSSSPLMMFDWNASTRKTTLPVGGGVGTAFKIGDQAFTGEVTGYWNALRQRNDAHWQLRIQITALMQNPLAGFQIIPDHGW